MRYSNDTLLMNPRTGSVDTYENWYSDYYTYKRETEDWGHEPDTWEQWGGDSLVEVEEVEDEDGETSYKEI